MKKILFVFFCLSLGFVGCSSDDDGDDGYYNPFIYGNWDTSPSNNSKFPFYCNSYSFIADYSVDEYYKKNVVIIDKIEYPDKYSSGNIPSESIAGTFKLNGNKITIESLVKGDGQEYKETIVLEIIELTETKLIIKENGKEITYKKS